MDQHEREGLKGYVSSVPSSQRLLALITRSVKNRQVLLRGLANQA
jgi:hypothetical protein